MRQIRRKRGFGEVFHEYCLDFRKKSTIFPQKRRAEMRKRGLNPRGKTIKNQSGINPYKKWENYDIEKLKKK